MHINKITKLKDNKYRIILEDNSLITYDNVILENDLLYKKNIDRELYKKIIKDTNYYDIYNKVVKYVMKKLRSEKEILIYLDKFEINSEDKNSIIRKLKSINLINDNDYCAAYINDKVYLGKDGINKIKKDLLNQNIPLDVIDNNISKIDNSLMNERLEKLIIKKIKLNNKYSNSYLKQKVLNDMINKGYNKEDVLLIIDKYLNEDDDILEKEITRLYNKLSVKYTGYDLLSKLKQKLIQKGFQMDKINKIIEEKIEQ